MLVISSSSSVYATLFYNSLVVLVAINTTIPNGVLVDASTIRTSDQLLFQSRSLSRRAYRERGHQSIEGFVADTFDASEKTRERMLDARRGANYQGDDLRRKKEKVQQEREERKKRANEDAQNIEQRENESIVNARAEIKKLEERIERMRESVEASLEKERVSENVKNKAIEDADKWSEAEERKCDADEKDRKADTRRKMLMFQKEEKTFTTQKAEAWRVMNGMRAKLKEAIAKHTKAAKLVEGATADEKAGRDEEAEQKRGEARELVDVDCQRIAGEARLSVGKNTKAGFEEASRDFEKLYQAYKKTY